MGTIAEKLNYLNTTKTNIKNAIVAKGVEVSENDTFRSYADKIASIGSDAYKLVTDTTASAVKTITTAPLPFNSLKVGIDAVQDLHGYDKPWVGGAGKNKLPLTVDGIKSANTSGTWSGNAYTLNGVTFEILTDSAGNVEGIKVNGTASMNAYFDLVQSFNSTEYTGMIANFSGAVSGTWIRISTSDRVAIQDIYGGDTVIGNNGDNLKLAIRVGYNESSNTTIRPMIRLASESGTTFAPYSNICPISGWDAVNLNISDADTSNPTTYTETLATTNYGGYWDVTKGEIGTTHHNIASYNGETLPGAWISSMDEYAEGGTPTTGAQVVYELATPTTTSTTPRFIKANDGTTNLWADSGDIEEVGFFEEFNA